MTRRYATAAAFKEALVSRARGTPARIAPYSHRLQEAR